MPQQPANDDEAAYRYDANAAADDDDVDEDEDECRVCRGPAEAGCVKKEDSRGVCFVHVPFAVYDAHAVL
jgi:hypothetical protein